MGERAAARGGRGPRLRGDAREWEDMARRSDRRLYQNGKSLSRGSSCQSGPSGLAVVGIGQVMAGELTGKVRKVGRLPTLRLLTTWVVKHQWN